MKSYFISLKSEMAFELHLKIKGTQVSAEQKNKSTRDKCSSTGPSSDRAIHSLRNLPFVKTTAMMPWGFFHSFSLFYLEHSYEEQAGEVA